MEFTEVKYAKTVEGNFEVKLINKNVVVATLSFPTEGLAKEYTEFKQKAKAEYDLLLAKVKADVTAELKAVVPAAKQIIADGVDNIKEAVETVTGIVTEAKTDVVPPSQPTTSRIKTDVELEAEDSTPIPNGKKQPARIDTSAKVAPSPDVNWQESARAKVGKDTIIDTSAKAAKDTIIDTSAKSVFPE